MFGFVTDFSFFAQPSLNALNDVFKKILNFGVSSILNTKYQVHLQKFLKTLLPAIMNY